jgi:paraquat-inducible protein A
MNAVACRDCDLLHAAEPLAPGARARCVRCGGALSVPEARVPDAWLAIVVAALIAFGIANTAPLMGLSELGRFSSATLPGVAWEMWAEGSEVAAIVIAICSIIAPGAYLVLMLVTLLAVRRDPAPRWAGVFLRWADSLHPWVMAEVMLLGTLVAYVKISELAHASPGEGMYAVAALAVLIAWLRAAVNPAALWTRIRWAR